MYVLFQYWERVGPANLFSTAWGTVYHLTNNHETWSMGSCGGVTRQVGRGGSLEDVVIWNSESFQGPYGCHDISRQTRAEGQKFMAHRLQTVTRKATQT